MTSEDDYKEKALDRADKKIRFYKALAGWAGFNVFIFIIWVISGGHRGGNPWFLWVLGITGIGIVVHFFKVFVVGTSWEDKIREKELEKLKSR